MFFRFMSPSLSRCLEIVTTHAATNRRKSHWYTFPVQSLIAHIGDKRITAVTSADILGWYDHISTRDSIHAQRGGKPLSAWTVDSYARAIRAFFNKLVEMGHIDASPAARLRLPKLPRKGKKEIPQSDISLIVQHAEARPRDHAIVLVLRDSGCRVGELVTMRQSTIFIEGEKGKALVTGKMNKTRWIFFRGEAVAAIKRYGRTRPHDAGDLFWVSGQGGGLTETGVYQMLKRIAKRAGVRQFNPHGFRHAFAKRLLESGAPSKVVADLMGHEDVTLTLSMYIAYDEDELSDLHDKYLSKQPIASVRMPPLTIAS